MMSFALWKALGRFTVSGPRPTSSSPPTAAIAPSTPRTVALSSRRLTDSPEPRPSAGERSLPQRRAPGSSPSVLRGKPLLHGERRRRRHILPFDEQFSGGAAGARQRDLEGLDRRRRLAHGERSATQFGGRIIGGAALANAVR